MFVTSTVVPPLMVSTSSGRIGSAPSMFSEMHIQAVTLTGSSSSAAARVTAITVAAPVMSYFMPSMLDAGLSESPPVSYVMPLPTRARCFVAPSGA